MGLMVDVSLRDLWSSVVKLFVLKDPVLRGPLSCEPFCWVPRALRGLQPGSEWTIVLKGTMSRQTLSTGVWKATGLEGVSLTFSIRSLISTGILLIHFQGLPWVRNQATIVVWWRFAVGLVPDFSPQVEASTMPFPLYSVSGMSCPLDIPTVLSRWCRRLKVCFPQQWPHGDGCS